ncbi:unnamed protein product [Ectocarpus sp. 12 AP-2014]
MTVRVRLQRLGRRNRPFYRVVVADSRAPRDGKFIELVGTYNPLATRSGVKEVTFKVDRIRYWISVGAQPSDRVAWLLGQFGILPPKVIPVARTKQTVPRKEWKELQKKQAGGKGFHTSAACFTALQPGTGEPVSDPLPRTLFSASYDGELTDGIATRRPSSGVSQYPSLETRPLSFWWGTGAERETHRNGEAISTTAIGPDELGGGIALDLSRMSLTGRSAGEQQARSPLRAVLASHLSLLGPAACSVIGLRVDTEEEARDTR